MIFVSQYDISNTRTLIKVRVGCKFKRRISSIIFDKVSKLYHWKGTKEDRQLTTGEVARLIKAIRR